MPTIHSCVVQMLGSDERLRVNFHHVIKSCALSIKIKYKRNPSSKRLQIQFGGFPRQDEEYQEVQQY